jgi:quercetin dioxygenase-like cupin family protein
MKVYNWESIPLEQLNPLLGRQALHGEKMTVAMIHLDKGCVVPGHSHANEQISVMLQGRIEFRSPGRETLTLQAGQMLHIPPDEPHEVVALEDSLVMDLFAPAREDWRTGDDAYLRGPNK